jgi:MerR family transcriptional regulator, mercuric resistance operon regulatory protein
MSEHLTVSGLASRVGVSPDAVRYYERLGLLAAPARSAAGYRRYDEGAVQRPRFVKGAQRVGLRLREIAELLQVVDRGQCPCGHTEALLRERLAEVDAELARLGALRGELVRLLAQAPGEACTVERPRAGGACRRLLGREVMAMAACPNCGCPCGERPCPCCGAP